MNAATVHQHKVEPCPNLETGWAPGCDGDEDEGQQRWNKKAHSGDDKTVGLTT